MSESANSGTPRRQFIKNTAGSPPLALAGVAIPAVHAAEDNTIRLALIGCGGRGCGRWPRLSAGGLVVDDRYRHEGEENAAHRRSSWWRWPI